MVRARERDVGVGVLIQRDPRRSRAGPVGGGCYSLSLAGARTPRSLMPLVAVMHSS